MGKRLELTGKKFGRLLVLEFSHIKQDSYWKCLCDCGNIKVLRGYTMVRGDIISCGCFGKEIRKKSLIERNKARTLPNNRNAKNVIYSKYKQMAQKRNLIFELTFEELVEIVISNCHYCNNIPSNFKKLKKTSSQMYYSGIDRKNNSIGYTAENCVPCCWTCNRMKNSLNYTTFLDVIKKIYKNRLTK